MSEFPVRYDDGVHVVPYPSSGVHPEKQKPDTVRVLNYSHGLGPNGEEGGCNRDGEGAVDVASTTHATNTRYGSDVGVSGTTMLKRQHTSSVDAYSSISKPTNNHRGNHDGHDINHDHVEDAAGDNVRSSILELCEVKRQEDLMKRLEAKAQRAIQMSAGVDVRKSLDQQQYPNSSALSAVVGSSNTNVGVGAGQVVVSGIAATPTNTTPAVAAAPYSLPSTTIASDAMLELQRMPFTYNSLGRQYVEKKQRVFSATVSRAQKQRDFDKTQHQVTPNNRQSTIASVVGHKPLTHRDVDCIVDNALEEIEHTANIDDCGGDGVESPKRNSQTSCSTLTSANGVAIDDMVGDETLVQCRSAVPIGGKTAFTVPFKLGRPLHELRTIIARAISGGVDALFAPTTQLPTLTMHDGENTTPLPTNRTFLDLGYRFAPLITIKGLKPIYFIQTAGSTARYEAPWTPHMTLSDVCKAVNKKLLPYDFSRVRLSVLDVNSVEMGQAVRRLLPIGPCLRFEPTSMIPNPHQTTLARAGLEKRIGDPIRVRFMRSVCGVPFYFNLPDTFGNDTAWETARRGEEMSDEWLLSLRTDPVESRAVLSKIPSLAPCTTSPVAAGSASPFRGVNESRTSIPRRTGLPSLNQKEVDLNVVLTAALTMQFDDHDESISPLGVRSVFIHTSTAPANTSANNNTTTSGTRIASESAKATATTPKGYNTISYNPTPEYLLASRTATFLSIEDNYAIRHATDCGIFPGMAVFVEHLDPDRKQWSGNVFEFGTGRRLPPSLSQPPEGTSGISNLNEDDFEPEGGTGGESYRRHNHNKWLVPEEDFLTIRSHRGSHQLYRIPANSHDRVQTILERIWAVTGDVPSSTLLFTEQGQLLAPHVTLYDRRISATSTLITRTRPYTWMDGTPEAEIIQNLSNEVKNSCQTAWGVDVLSA